MGPDLDRPAETAGVHGEPLQVCGDQQVVKRQDLRTLGVGKRADDDPVAEPARSAGDVGVPGPRRAELQMDRHRVTFPGPSHLRHEPGSAEEPGEPAERRPGHIAAHDRREHHPQLVALDDEFAVELERVGNAVGGALAVRIRGRIRSGQPVEQHLVEHHFGQWSAGLTVGEGSGRQFREQPAAPRVVLLGPGRGGRDRAAPRILIALRRPQPRFHVEEFGDRHRSLGPVALHERLVVGAQMRGRGARRREAPQHGGRPLELLAHVRRQHHVRVQREIHLEDVAGGAHAGHALPHRAQGLQPLDTGSQFLAPPQLAPYSVEFGPQGQCVRKPRDDMAEWITGVRGRHQVRVQEAPQHQGVHEVGHGRDGCGREGDTHAPDQLGEGDGLCGLLQHLGDHRRMTQAHLPPGIARAGGNVRQCHARAPDDVLLVGDEEQAGQDRGVLVQPAHDRGEPAEIGAYGGPVPLAPAGRDAVAEPGERHAGKQSEGGRPGRHPQPVAADRGRGAAQRVSRRRRVPGEHLGQRGAGHLDRLPEQRVGRGLGDIGGEVGVRRARRGVGVLGYGPGGGPQKYRFSGREQPFLSCRALSAHSSPSPYECRNPPLSSGGSGNCDQVEQAMCPMMQNPFPFCSQSLTRPVARGLPSIRSLRDPQPKREEFLMTNETTQDLFDLDVREVLAEGEAQNSAGISISCEGSCHRPYCI